MTLHSFLFMSTVFQFLSQKNAFCIYNIRRLVSMICVVNSIPVCIHVCIHVWVWVFFRITAVLFAWTMNWFENRFRLDQTIELKEKTQQTHRRDNWIDSKNRRKPEKTGIWYKTTCKITISRFKKRVFDYQNTQSADASNGYMFLLRMMLRLVLTECWFL